MSERDELLALDRAHVWRPYTSADAWEREPDPLVLARAEGSRLYDVDGRSYIDGNSSWWTALLGHGHPRIVAALARQAGSLGHVALAGITHEPAARLAAELVAVAPRGLERVFFSDNGSTAVEVALKMAVQGFLQRGAPERQRFIALDGAFHGETLGVTALGGVELFRRPFAGLLFDCLRVPSAADGHARAFADLERVFAAEGRAIAALVLEPLVQGAAGMRMYDPEYLRRARALTREHGALLVLDEVFTGYGRTGPMWAADHADIAPDLLCTGKGFSGGLLPFAATLATAEVFDAFRGAPERALMYGHTYCGNPLGAAVAREVLAVYRDEHILERAAPKARRIAAAFTRFAELPRARAARSLGMIGALELDGEGYLDPIGWRVYREALARGAYLRPLGNVVYVAPALNIPDGELDELLTVLGASLRAVLT